jgi:hypothetical protein
VEEGVTKFISWYLEYNKTWPLVVLVKKLKQPSQLSCYSRPIS